MNRAEFMAKVHGLMKEEDARQVELAYLLSKKIHRGQVRKELDENGQPLRYFEHVRRVALVLLDEVGCSSPELIISALLHDSIEDTDEVQLVGILLERLFGSEVATIVRALSKAPKAGYIERLRAGPHEALLVKAADRLDNLRSLPTYDIAFCDKQRRETIEVYLPLFNSISASSMDTVLREITKLV